MKRLSINISLLVFLFTFLSIIKNNKSTLFCQSNNLRFDHLSIEDGLPDNGFSCIIQDRLGFIWIGTGNGLSKYDGYSFVNYNSNEKDSTDLIARQILCLMEDSNGDIWIGTYFGISILLRDEDRFISYKYDKNDPNSLSYNWVTKIFEDKKGNVWIGTNGNGLNFIDRELLLDKKEKLIFQHITLDNYIEGTEFIFDIMEDSENTIWACTKNGLLKIPDGKAELIQPIKSNLYNQRNHFLTIINDKKGLFWLGTSGNGVAVYNKNTKDFTFFTDNRASLNKYSFSSIASLLLDSEGNLWAGEENEQARIGGGFFLFDRTTKKLNIISHDPLNPSSISENNGATRSIFEDNFGNIWFAKFWGKINQLTQQNNLFKYYRNYLGFENSILFSKNTRMLEAKDGRLWFASENGLFEYFPDEERFVKVIAENQDGYCALDNMWGQIIEDIKGNLWTAGINTELREYNPNTGVMRCFDKAINLPHTDIVNILSDKSGIMWFGTGSAGLYRYNPKTKDVINYKYNMADFSTISHDKIGVMCEVSSNTIWISTLDCWLNKFNKETGKFKRMNISDYIGYFCDLFVDEKNRIWAGTTLGGIYLFNTENDNYRRINTDHGLPSNINVTGFSEDHNGNIYCCSRKHLIKFDQNGDLENYYKIATDDEVLHQTYYVKKTKEVFVVSDKGFYRFFADSLKQNLIPPKMVLTNLKFEDKQSKVGEDSPLKVHINVAEKIELEYWQHDFTIQYSALYYNNQDENNYKYILENYDSDWRDAGKNREATYTNLDPGLYNFKVLGCNYNGTWAAEPATLAITILPPWWITWWAYIIYSLTIIGILSSIYYQQRRRLRVIHRLEMKEFESNKLKEVDQMKSKFFENISHEFRTPLTLIKGPIEQLLDNDKVENRKNIYKMIKRNSERLLNLCSELLDLSKLEYGKMKLRAQKNDIVSFVKMLALSFESLGKKKGIKISISSSSELIEVYYDKEKIQKIITNLLSNAFKFTQERGEVSVSIEEVISEQKLYIRILDSGIGLSEEELPKIFDRFYQADNSSYEGTGIGLSLTKELVELHHGEISVESTVGKGTSVTLSFSLGREHLQDEELIHNDSELVFKEEKENEGFVLTSSGKERKPMILVVEDNEDIKDFIISILKNDYKLFESTNGKDGYKKAVELVPDLIVSDIVMPKLTGDEMCERLKNNQITSHIPIILLTAKTSSMDKINGLKIGADDYLIKPFNEKELLARINNLIVQRRNLREKYLREAEIHPTEVAVTSADKKFIEAVIQLVEKNISNTEFHVELMAAELRMSRIQLYRKFTSILGEKPTDFIKKHRINRAASLIRKRFGNMTDVAYAVGFDNLSYFSKCFKQIYNQSPLKYEKNYLNNKKK